jgi:CRP/FNR family cyclic AMP-dependent transcriptional regulator
VIFLSRLENGVVEDGSFLALVSQETASAIAKLGRRRMFPRGTTLLRQGQPPHHVLLLLRGRVKVAYATDEGREVLFDVLGPGQLVGEVAAVDGNPADASAVAIDDVDTLVVEGGTFQRFVQADPEVARIMLRLLTRRVRKATQDRAALAMNDALGRVCLRLVELADRYGDQVDGRIRITLPLSQQELAAWTGTSREATSKALHTLRRRGYIETRRREIHVLDIGELRERVTGDPTELQVNMLL